MNFHPIDIANWKRRETFEHFLNQDTTFSITAEIDIRALHRQAKRKAYKLYPAWIYLVTRVINAHAAFRMGYDRDGAFGYWDRLEPLYTIFDRESESFSGIWTAASDDFRAFHAAYLSDASAHAGMGRLLPKQPIPDNVFSVSMIPWTSFTGFNLNIRNNRRHLLPIVTAGKFMHRGDAVVLPVSLQVHHAVCDGYHAGVFMNAVQEMADRSDHWLI